MSVIRYRAAEPADAAAIGAVHVASWRETYRGLLPDQLLDGASVHDRAAMWRSVLEEGDTALFVAQAGTEIVGFAACGPQRDAGLSERGYDAEIGAIYVLKSHQRAGAGRALIRLTVQQLLGRGRAGVALWVLRENHGARAFYEKIGGTHVAEKTEEQSGATFHEVAYGWSDLHLLIAAVS